MNMPADVVIWGQNSSRASIEAGHVHKQATNPVLAEGEYACQRRHLGLQGLD
jgi:hypothetical protein